jgi:hypothetical protein
MASEPPAPPAASFGARFVDELFRVTGSRAHFGYALIQELRRADREQAIALLRSRAQLDSRTIARLKTEEPEAVARELGAAILASGNAVAAGALGVLAGILLSP